MLIIHEIKFYRINSEGLDWFLNWFFNQFTVEDVSLVSRHDDHDTISYYMEDLIPRWVRFTETNFLPKLTLKILRHFLYFEKN